MIDRLFFIFLFSCIAHNPFSFQIRSGRLVLKSFTQQHVPKIVRLVDDDDLLEDDFEEEMRQRISKRNGSNTSKGKPPKRSMVFNFKEKWSVVNKALLAGIFVAGIGTGVTIDSAINTNPKDLASRDAIDRNAPNSRVCATYGSSAMVLDQRVFVTFNPFNVYVTQGKNTVKIEKIFKSETVCF
jgi:hypothetical protein